MIKFDDGGDADPNSDKKMSITVRAGHRVDFQSRDGEFYQFGTGTLFSGLPLAMFTFLSKNLTGETKI